LKIPALLAGILTMIALYSVNLRIMGKANLSLLGVGYGVLGRAGKRPGRGQYVPR
jgi:ABC-type uncharacterized transport system permease subunit